MRDCDRRFRTRWSEDAGTSEVRTPQVNACGRFQRASALIQASLRDSALLLDAVKLGPAAEEEGVAGDGGRGHEAVAELVLGELLELAAGGEDRGLAFLAEEVDAVAGGERRGGVMSAQALAPEVPCRSSLPSRWRRRCPRWRRANRPGAAGTASWARCGWSSRPPATACPGGPGCLGVEDLALLARPDRQHLPAGKAGGHEDQSVAGHGAGGGGVAGALFHAPQLGAGRGVVGVERLRALAQQGGLPVERRDLAGGEGLAEVAAQLGLAVGAKVLEVNGALLLPDRLAGLLVQRDDELVVAAVEVQEEQVAVEDGRGAGAAEMIALDVAPRPRAPCRFACPGRRCPARRRSHRPAPPRWPAWARHRC